MSVPAIGIDLGTTNSCVAVFQNGKVEIIANDKGDRTTPSCVAFSNTERLFGKSAENKVTSNPYYTIFDAKRLIGRKFGDEAVQRDRIYWPFTVKKDDGKPKIEVVFESKKKLFMPEQISAMILTKMKKTAESYLGKYVTDAVISVPAHFNYSQRQATIDAGVIAGLNVLRIINEPTAAAIAYSFENPTNDSNILIYDLGGGSFDVSIINIENRTFEVQATAGNTRLGGDDFDNKLVNFCARKFLQRNNIDVKKNKKSIGMLRTACERVKILLSSYLRARIEITSLCEGIDFSESISRFEFEKLCFGLFHETIEIVEKVLLDARLKKEQISKIILIGGSTKIPKIRRLLHDFFLRRPFNTSLDTHEAVAYGAAVQAASLIGDSSANIKNLLVNDVIPLSLTVETADGEVFHPITRNNYFPTKTLIVLCKFSDNQSICSFNLFAGERKRTKDNYNLGNFVLSDITPHPKNVIRIEVTFTVDANGILNVSSAVEYAYDKSRSLTITKDQRIFCQQELDGLAREEERYAEEDVEQRELAFCSIKLQSLCSSINTTLSKSTASAKLSADEISAMNITAEDHVNWVTNDEFKKKEEIEDKLRLLEEAWLLLSNKISHSNGNDGNTQIPSQDSTMKVD